MIKFAKLNESYIRLICDSHILHELAPHFTFKAENYQFTPAGKRGWNGDIILLSTKTGRIYTGLLKTVILKCKELGYNEYSFEGFESNSIEYTEDDVLTAIESFNLPVDRQPREHQLNAVLTCLMGNRRICLSATNSGKSLVQYIISRVLIESDKKVLIIVPSVFLVDQMFSDFESYAINDSFSIEDNYHKIFAGQNKSSKKPCYISTYQSIMSLPKEDLAEYLSLFDSVICDECLHPDSLITMADYTKKKISDIMVNDIVQTYNEQTKLIENNKVIQVHKNLLNSITNDMYQITLTNGDILKLTGNHKVYTNTGWVEVQKLNGDEEIEIY